MNEKYDMVWSAEKQLYRIVAMKSFRDVKKGDIGGFIESEKNLSSLGDAWISHNASVIENALVCHNATVRDNGFVCDNAFVCHNAIVRDNGFVCDNAIVCHNANLSCNSIASDNSIVRDGAIIGGLAVLRDNSIIGGNAIIYNEQEYKDYTSCGQGEFTLRQLTDEIKTLKSSLDELLTLNPYNYRPSVKVTLDKIKKWLDESSTLTESTNLLHKKTFK